MAHEEYGRKKDPEKKMEQWNNFLGNFKNPVKSLIGPNTTFSTLLDTIIITSRNNNYEKLLILAASVLIPYFIWSILIGMPLRGCITIGNFHQQKSLIIDQAIDEAAECYPLHQWIGISCSPTANHFVKQRKNNPSFKTFFREYDIPLKNSIEQNAWVLNWVTDSNYIISQFSRDLTLKQYNDTLQLINENLKSASDIEVSLKWRNTLKFEMVNKP